MKTIDGKNRIIASISSGSLIGFLPHVKKDMADYSYKAYTNKEAWTKMALANIANAGFFSSDRTIQEYVDDIWHLDKIDM